MEQKLKLIANDIINQLKADGILSSIFLKAESSNTVLKSATYDIQINKHIHLSVHIFLNFEKELIIQIINMNGKIDTEGLIEIIKSLDSVKVKIRKYF